MRLFVTPALLLASMVALACGSDPKPPPAAPATSARAPVKPTPAPEPLADDKKKTDVPSRSQINISDEIRKACGISDADAYFAFDSANIRPQDHKVLAQLADCFATGPLKGRNMRLVGHADPRGDGEYNMVLGGRRAENVKEFIGQKGLGSNRMETTSRGEMDSTGTDESGWSRDRRVDILLAQ
jgi:peptidoglycan-associated lipoprotein